MRGEDVERERIVTLCDDIQEELGLDWWTIVHRFSGAHADSEADRVACHTTVDWEYRQAGMLWYLRETMAEDDASLRLIVLHEMVHVMLSPMESLVDDGLLRDKLCELAVENVTRALSRRV